MICLPRRYGKHRLTGQLRMRDAVRPSPERDTASAYPASRQASNSPTIRAPSTMISAPGLTLSFIELGCCRKVPAVRELLDSMWPVHAPLKGRPRLNESSASSLFALNRKDHGRRPIASPAIPGPGSQCWLRQLADRRSHSPIRSRMNAACSTPGHRGRCPRAEFATNHPGKHHFRRKALAEPALDDKFMTVSV